MRKKGITQKKRRTICSPFIAVSESPWESRREREARVFHWLISRTRRGRTGRSRLRRVRAPAKLTNEGARERCAISPSAPSLIYGIRRTWARDAKDAQVGRPGAERRPGAAASAKVFAVRDRMIDVCSGKKNARFAAVTKWQIGVETSARATWASANFGVGSLSLSLSRVEGNRYYTYTTRMLNDFFLALKSRRVERDAH